jgi:hypothetical protein
MTNGNEISAHSISKELACGFISDDLIKDWRQVFPTKLICISTSPFDRFLLNNTAKSSYNDLYSYIGMKSARRNNSVKSLISNVVDTMFKKPNSIDTNIDVIKKTLEYLGYGTRILVSYSRSPQIGYIFPITLEKVNSAIEQLSHDSTFDNEIDKKSYAKDIYESLVYLQKTNNIETKKRFLYH